MEQGSTEDGESGGRWVGSKGGMAPHCGGLRARGWTSYAAISFPPTAVSTRVGFCTNNGQHPPYTNTRVHVSLRPPERTLNAVCAASRHSPGVVREIVTALFAVTFVLVS